MFPDISNLVDEGAIGAPEVDQLLDDYYGPDETPEKTDRRSRVIKDGRVIKFQVVGLNRQVTDKIRAEGAAARNYPPIIDPIPAEFLQDVPEPPDELENHGPDYVPEIKSRVGILTAVRKWGKPESKPLRANRIEGIKFRCPFEDHVDLNPSAWANRDKNLWHCGKCDTGGDVIDFYAARRHGLHPSQFHSSSDFRRIVMEMAEELGIVLTETPDGELVVEADDQDWPSSRPDGPEREEPAPVPEITFEPVDPLAEEELFKPVVPPSAEASEPITISVDKVERGLVLDTSDLDTIEESEEIPPMDWSILAIEEGTFLDLWLRYHTEHFPWVPVEYFVALGIQAVGACGGQYVHAEVGSGAIHTGALMALLVGPSGTGKSFSVSRLDDLFSEAVPFRHDDGEGLKILPQMGSPEALVYGIKTEIEDPANAVQKLEVPTTAWYHEDEFAELIARTRRIGSGGDFKSKLITLYDFRNATINPKIAVRHQTKGSGIDEVSDVFLTATFTTQERSLRDLVASGDLHSGFMGRIVPIFGGRTPFPDHGQPMAPVADYYEPYQAIWKRCRRGGKWTVPMTDDAVEYGNDPAGPVHNRIFPMRNEHPLYGRLWDTTLKIAFALALNNGKSMIDRPTYASAARFVDAYLIPAYAHLMAHVRSSEADYAVGEFVAWIEKWYKDNNVLPEKNSLYRAKFYKNMNAESRKAFIEAERTSGRVAEIQLERDGGQRKFVKTCYVSMDGFAGLPSAPDGKKYPQEDFYKALRLK